MSDIWIGKASDVFVVAATLIHARTHLVMGRASCGIIRSHSNKSSTADLLETTRKHSGLKYRIKRDVVNEARP